MEWGCRDLLPLSFGLTSAQILFRKIHPDSNKTIMHRLLIISLGLFASVALSGSVKPVTNFDGTGDVREGVNYQNGQPSSSHPGLVSGTASATSAWLGDYWEALCIRQTGGTLHALPNKGANFDMRGGTKGVDALYEVDDSASSLETDFTFNIAGK